MLEVRGGLEDTKERGNFRMEGEWSLYGRGVRERGFRGYTFFRIED